jgi:vacuolar-type H+-ATPase subunit D/Vma8
MIHELNESLKNLVLMESKEDKLNYLLLGGDETKRWVNTILYSLKKGF